MDTPNKNWSQLTARARAAGPPEIDVRTAVRHTITKPFAPRIPSPLFSGKWLVGSLAALTLFAATSGYIGLRAAPELSFALGFSTSF